MGLTLGGSGIQTGLHYLKRTTVELDKSLQQEAAVAAVAQANVNMKNVFDLLISSVGRD